MPCPSWTEPLDLIRQSERFDKIPERVGRQTGIAGAGIYERVDPWTELRHRSHLRKHSPFRRTIVRNQRRTAKPRRDVRPKFGKLWCNGQLFAQFGVAPYGTGREGSVPNVKKSLPSGFREHDPILDLYKTQLPRFVGPSLHRAGCLEIQCRPDHGLPQYVRHPCIQSEPSNEVPQ